MSFMIYGFHALFLLGDLLEYLPDNICHLEIGPKYRVYLD